MKKLIIAATVAFAATGAQAQAYGELGYTALRSRIESNGQTFKAAPDALRGVIGYELNPHLALEGIVAVEASSAPLEYEGDKYHDYMYAVDYAFGVYLKPKIKLSDKVEVFGRTGFAEVKSLVNGFEFIPPTDRGFSYGAGISYAINATTSFSADYMQYLRKDGFTVSGLTFGFGFKF